MKKKILIGSFVVLTGLMVGLFAMSFSNNSNAKVNTVPVEQVSTTATNPEHCAPADCSTEKAATCPYSKTNATQEASANCPATSDCPPSKCSSTAKSDKATL
ncbi:MAG: hypothetical protein IPL12_01105 [Bacteroidetes bacterium]|nr:hypothetical protein [Bacteroidota bacterium]MBK8342023.1 hypothetical protein [Bacteroidota bacterium]